MKEPICHTAARLEQERNDPKANEVWDCDGMICIKTAHSELKFYVVEGHMRGTIASLVDTRGLKYLASSIEGYYAGYKDGIAIDNATIKLDEKKPAEWVDGLPPIGTVCEAQVVPIFVNMWQEATIAAISGNFAWVKWADQEEPISTNLSNLHFRPILTPKQRTIEAAMKHNKSHHWTRREFIEELYNVGFVSMPEGKSND